MLLSDQLPWVTPSFVEFRRTLVVLRAPTSLLCLRLVGSQPTPLFERLSKDSTSIAVYLPMARRSAPSATANPSAPLSVFLLLSPFDA